MISALAAKLKLIVGDEIPVRPKRLRQNDPLPAVKYTTISGGDHAALDGNSGIFHLTVQVDCYEQTELAAETLGNQVYASLANWSGDAESVYLVESTLVRSHDGVDDPAEGSDDYRYIFSQDFKFFYRNK